MFKTIARLLQTSPTSSQALTPIQSMPLRDTREAQLVQAAMCQEIAELRRIVETVAPVKLTPIDPTSRCPIVSGQSSGPAACPRASSNYASDGLYTGDPKNWVPAPCPMCR